MKRRNHQEETGLIFDWSKRDGSSGRLFVSGLVAVGALVALFIAFRVITPESRPIVSRPQQVLVLNPAIPAERALIHQAMDRSFALLPTESTTDSLPQAAQMPAFRPALADFELTPRPMSSTTKAATAPRFLTTRLEPPPDHSAAPKISFPNSEPSALEAVIEGKAANRLAGQVVFDEVPLLDPSRPRFRLAVGPQGQVVMALPLLSSEDPANIDRLRQALMQIRFAPAEASVEWAEVSFRWREKK